MKKAIILLIIGMITISMNAQQNKQNLDYLNRAKTKVRTGATLLVVGGVTMIGGAVVYAKGISESLGDDYTNDADVFNDKAVTGLVVMIVGEVLFDVGIPLLIVGSVQKGKAKRRLQMTMVNFKTPNSNDLITGVGLKVKF